MIELFRSPAWAVIALIATICRATPIAAAVTGAVGSGESQRVVLGIERLAESTYAERLQRARIGILAHDASRDSKGRHLVDLLPKGRLAAIFTPEHGFRTDGDGFLKDRARGPKGVPIYSLYGPRRGPDPKQLAGIDLLLIDLKDVGLRFYTYQATMALTIEAAFAAGKEVWILDRPNPLGGEVIEGPPLAPALTGRLAAFAALPMRHGMTMGELARFYVDHFGLEGALEVVTMKGWRRSMVWADTGLPWRAPSPRLPTPAQTYLYAAIGTIASTNLSMGKWVDPELAFWVFGSPAISAARARALAKQLNALGLTGLRFESASWVPKEIAYVGETCRGVRVTVANAELVRGPVLPRLLTLLQALHRELGTDFELTRKTAEFLGTRWLVAGIEQGVPVEALVRRADESLTTFLATRERLLLYR